VDAVSTLVVVTHEFDYFFARPRPGAPVRSPYLLFDVLKHLQGLGHKVRVSRGPHPESGDVALLHVDSTLVEQEYLDLASRYPRAINFGTGDISKRTVSRLLLAKGDSWDGPVIVKANFNNRAIVEDLHNQRAAKANKPPPHPGIAPGDPYEVLDSLAVVGAAVWSDPTLVVERFVPEQDEEGNFVLRTWVFMGPRERCTRLVTTDRISKAADVIRYEPIDVPEELRAERERLGFDFGKFDFVMRNGEPLLLDANRTPGVSRAIQPLLRKGAPNLAEGLHELMTGS
jgi:hypothetical protein